MVSLLAGRSSIGLTQFSSGRQSSGPASLLGLAWQTGQQARPSVEVTRILVREDRSGSGLPASIVLTGRGWERFTHRFPSASARNGKYRLVAGPTPIVHLPSRGGTENNTNVPVCLGWLVVVETARAPFAMYFPDFLRTGVAVANVRVNQQLQKEWT